MTFYMKNCENPGRSERLFKPSRKMLGYDKQKQL